MNWRKKYNLKISRKMENKKKYIFTILVILSSVVFLFAKPADAEVIKSATELDYSPFSFVNKTGQPDGFDVEFLRAALKSVGADVSFYIAPWSQIKQDLADGKIQVLPLVGINEERRKIYDFTDSFITFYGAIFVRQDDNKIKTENDLKMVSCGCF